MRIGSHSVSLPQPIGRQNEVLYLPPDGHTVVLGTAGSGKTTLAILRSLYLSDPQTDHGGPTLLTTFNRCLVTYMRHLAGELGVNVNVENYHKFARGYLSSSGVDLDDRICSTDERPALIEYALTKAQAEMQSSLFQRPTAFFDDEFQWIQAHGLRNAQDYIDSTHIGSSDRKVMRADRPTLFRVFELYLEARNSSGKLYDWSDLASAVIVALNDDDRERRYRHIVIDEGQDFSPQMIRSLAAAVPQEGSLTFFGDIAQQIYGQNMSWREAGLDPSKVWHFEENYRNSRQISQFALALANKREFPDDPDMVEPSHPIADGPLPALVRFHNQKSERDFILTRAGRLAQSGTVAILYRTRSQIPNMPRNATRLHRQLTTWPINPGLFYGTYHSAKGLEFDSVFLPNLSSDDWPPEEDIESLGYQEAVARNIKLLYVGLTRAKTNLVMTFNGNRTSMLPDDESLYEISDA